jgi:hypothetical protein
LNFNGADETYESHCSHHPPGSRLAGCTWPCYGAAFCYFDHNRTRPAAGAIAAAEYESARIGSEPTRIIAAAESASVVATSESATASA